MKPLTTLLRADTNRGSHINNDVDIQKITTTDHNPKTPSGITDNVELRLYHKQVCHIFNMNPDESFVHAFQHTSGIHGGNFRYAVDLNSPYIDMYATPRKHGITSGILCFVSYHASTGYIMNITPLSLLVHSVKIHDGSRNQKRKVQSQMYQAKRYKKMSLGVLVKELRA